MGSNPGLRIYYGATDKARLLSHLAALLCLSGLQAKPGQSMERELACKNRLAVPTYCNRTQGMSSRHNLNAVFVNHLTAFVASIITPVVVFGNSSPGYAHGWLSFQERSKVICAVQSYPSGLTGSTWGPTMAVEALDGEYAQPRSSSLGASECESSHRTSFSTVPMMIGKSM